MNKHVNKVRKATGRAEAIIAGRQQNKQQYLIIQLMKKKESIKTGQERKHTYKRQRRLVDRVKKDLDGMSERKYPPALRLTSVHGTGQ